MLLFSFNGLLTDEPSIFGCKFIDVLRITGSSHASGDAGVFKDFGISYLETL